MRVAFIIGTPLYDIDVSADICVTIVIAISEVILASQATFLADVDVQIGGMFLVIISVVTVSDTSEIAITDDINVMIVGSFDQRTFSATRGIVISIGIGQTETTDPKSDSHYCGTVTRSWPAAANISNGIGLGIGAGSISVVAI